MSTDVVCISTIQGSIVAEIEQGRLKGELSNLRRRGARNASGEEVQNQGRSCARCKAPLGRIYNTGASCPKCRHRVCKQCREYRGSNVTEWLCLVCHKIIEIQSVSFEWSNEASGVKRNVRRKFLASPADILKRSIRRSWTINGPPASWCAVRGSPELRAYQSLPRHQDYFEVTRTELVIPRIEKSLICNDNKESNKLFVKRSEICDEASFDTTDVVLINNEDINKEETINKDKRNDKDCEKFVKSDDNNKNDENLSSVTQNEGNHSQRISQIKPPRIHNKFHLNDVKQITAQKSAERKSNIPILRRSSREFEDIRSPLESAKRSLIPQRYRGSTDDLRRSREDITAHSQIPKLFSPRGVKEERLKRQDSKDEIRCGIKLPSIRKEDKKDTRDNSSGVFKFSLKKEEDNKSEIKSGIKIFRREGKDLGIESPQRSIKSSNSKDFDKISNEQNFDEESKFKFLITKQETKEKITKNDDIICSNNDFADESSCLNEDKKMVEKRDQLIDSNEPIKNERKFEALKREKIEKLNENENENETAVTKDEENKIAVKNLADSCDDDEQKNRKQYDEDDNEKISPSSLAAEKEAPEIMENNATKKFQEDHQVIARRKFSKEEFSNPDDTDDVPNRRSSSHLSPEASPLSTRSSRYSPRESESEPTPALPRKTGESISASQRVRDAITRTRRESNSSTRYESSGSESIRLSGNVETRRVRFGGSGSGIEEVQRDSATSAGEDEPRNSQHNQGNQRDSRTSTTGVLQGRAVRRRRQFDNQGSRRRGRSHARGCAEDFHHLQVLGRSGCASGDHLSPPLQVQQGQGQDQPIIDYRRLVFISSDSSSGREEDDADSSSGSSSLNGAPRSSLTQGLDDCDWDYFESGGSVPPLAHLQVGLVGSPQITSNSSQGFSRTQIHRSHNGNSLSSQDWSCCPGRGSSACQACGGARGANVFPVPVPIPVPVPYPVPVPASLWNSGLTNTSMINCTSAELRALQLSRGGGPSTLHPAAAQWFAWPPRFIHDVNVPRENDTQGVSDPRSREAAAAAFAFHHPRDYGETNPPESLVATELPAKIPTAKTGEREEVVEEEINVPETNAGPDVGEGREAEEDATTEEREESSSDSDSDEELNVKQNTTDSNSKNTQSKSCAKMYRLSQGNSGSSSGRSSADSSDLEDSASHHFSRVFVVNDDSSTSDNDPEDVEDVEDSDSNREVGITLRRVTALPEDGPVVLRHVRFLDEDRSPLESNNNFATGVEEDNSETKNTKNRNSKEETIRLKYLRNFDPEANEIYLVDSKDDDSEHSIELKSVKSIDPDLIEESSSSSSSALENLEKLNLDDENNVEMPDPDSLMPETIVDSCTIVPDSLEIHESSSSSEDCETNFYQPRILATRDICALYSPESSNDDDKPAILLATRQDKQLGLLSEIYDDKTLASGCSVESSTPCSSEAMSDSNANKTLNIADSSSLNLTGGSEKSTTASSETTTGSEVSSDELHEYEVITAWSANDTEEYGIRGDVQVESEIFSAVNKDLIIARNLLTEDKKLKCENEQRHRDDYGDENNGQNFDTISGFTSDDFSTDEGGSSRLDSGVATGVEDTNPSGRTDDGSTASLETTPGESIELVHSSAAGIGDNIYANDKTCCDAINEGDKYETELSIGNKSVANYSPNDVKLLDKIGDKINKNDDRSVNDLISIKIQEIFKNVNVSPSTGIIRGNDDDDDKSVAKVERGAAAAAAAAATEVERGAIVDGGERIELKQVEGDYDNDHENDDDDDDADNGERSERATAQVSSVVRRPPVVKDGFYPGGKVLCEKSNPVKNNPQNINGNRYKSLVMITQGAYQPVNVVTSDTTTLLQPDESPSPPRGLAGYYHLALETAADIPLRNGTSGPRRPLTVKRPTPQPRVVNIEPEVDSGLSVGSASESDDVQSVKSASKVPATVTTTTTTTTTSTPSSDQTVDQTVSNSNNDKSLINELSSRSRTVETITSSSSSSSVVVILEEGLADDDSWVEEVSHDEDEQGATTATEESSEDEANNMGDREEELRGYHRQAIDFTLHTIVEESCEESEAEPSSLAIESPRKQRPPSASELEKYFFFGLGEGAANIGGGSREIDSLSETSSIYSEGLESLGQDEPGQNTEKNSPDYLNSSSRLEKYFLSDFLGFDRDRRDSDGSVGSDSEGRPSPEQRRKRLVRARGTGRSHSSSLDNLLALTQSSANLSSQNSLQDLSLNPDSQETQSEGSSTETDGADDQMPAFGTDGQFDTVKRKKKKPRNLGTQSPRISDDRNKTPEPAMIEADGDLLEAINSEDDRAKTPQPDTAFLNSSQLSAKQTLQVSDSAHLPGRSKQLQQSDSGRGNGGQGNEVNLPRGKQQSRDSGFIGSCDDLLQHQRVSTSSDSQNSMGNQDPGKQDFHNERRSGSDIKYKEGGTSSRVEQSVSQVSLAPPNASLSRKDSFNNWSSDEETNLMMSKMRQFFKTMVANSNNGQNSNNSSAASPAPSPRLPGSSPRSRIGSQNRTKPPQLVYFENELTRLMKTVPGIRDEQVKEIVEYLSSEDTWSDSYDSSDYTSSDLEGAGGRRSALQEQISQSCQQIISKFDTTGTGVEPVIPGKETLPSTQPAQPLNCRDTAFVYQKLVQSFTKMTGDGVSSDASSTPHSSPPLIAKVMHHIGSRLVALMHEVSEGGPAVQPSSWRRYPHHRTPSSASTTEDDDSTSDSANTPAQHQLPRSKSHDPLLLLNGHPTPGYQEGEEREASDNERFSWRGSFESALMPADSRTKLSLLACSGDVSASASALAMAAKRRSAGDLLFNPKSLSREQLDRVRSCGSIGGGSASIEDKIWSNRRRSSVPDANTRGESGASAGDDDTEDELEYNGDSRATTLPRGLQAAATATNSLPRLPAVSPISGPVTMHKAHSVHHFLQQHNNVKSARYRPPGFARNNLTTGGAVSGPKRAVSAPGLQLPAGSTSAGKRETARNRRQAVSLTPDDGSSLLEACSTPIIGGARAGSLSNDDDMDRNLHASLLRNRASSSSLGARSDSMASVYSGAGEGRWCGSVAVTGEVEFALQYDYKQKTFEVRVTQCRDLAPVDVKRNRSDPYVKVYLLPDKSKGGKRKTKVKKHTLNPVFDETLKFHMSLNGLETRTLWLTVWHSDMFGRNDFLGEVRMPLENKIFDDITPRWYPLQERSEPFDDPITNKGEVIVWLKFVPPDPTQQQDRLGDHNNVGEKIGSKARKSWSKGALHVLVKEARNLQTRAKNGGTCAPFCKSYLLPDKGRSGKQKTGVVRRCTGGSPVWGHTFIYKDVSLQELAERGIELTVWDHDRIASNEFLGGVRFNLGTGKHYGKPVEWMDATGREITLWQSMLERPNFWVEDVVALRPNLHNHSRNNTT